MIHMHYLFRLAENNLWRVRDELRSRCSPRCEQVRPQCVRRLQEKTSLSPPGG